MHVLAVKLDGRDVPKDMEVDHLCRNRKCCNPKHLEVVTPKINNWRSNSPAAINHRKTHCSNGHEFTLENTYIRKDGNGRMCKICGKIRNRDKKRKKVIELKKNLVCIECGKPFSKWGKFKGWKYCSSKCCSKNAMRAFLIRNKYKEVEL